ncbi:hypothetical protein [Aliiglaciecola sp. M165]|uniref:hypothetical protein n=1 Tax=Aliiglaciecola sp. M165 TaxID=2593649 RepID=UPI00117EC633|nr:hypothetical protein [Aliiglaciecola sp. M165]TRY30333.1 hypothetical protein FM019_16105 [Aliiglaciecola sp. M165]
MRKSLFCALLFIATHSSAFEIDTEACAGTEYIYDLENNLVEYDASTHTFVTPSTPVFYAAFENIAHIWLNTYRYSNILVTNTSEAPISFFYRPSYFLDSNGLETNASPESYSGVFNNSNSPKLDAGAMMPSNSMGRIKLSPTTSITYGTAQIYWNSSTCFQTPPLVTSVESSYFKSGDGAISVQLTNNGKNW